MQQTLRSGLVLLLMVPSLVTLSACTKEATVKKESEIKIEQADSSPAKASENKPVTEVELKEAPRTEAQERELRAARIKFVYEDISSQEVEKYTYKYIRDENIDGIDFYVVERYPVDKKSGYSCAMPADNSIASICPSP